MGKDARCVGSQGGGAERRANTPGAGKIGAPPMTQNQKIIRVKVGVLELAKQLGNVSQACKMMGFRAIVSTASETSMRPAASWH